MASSARIVEHVPARPSPLREELEQRVAQLDRDFRLLSVGELCRRADMIRHIARGEGLLPVARLAEGLGDTLARNGRAAHVRPWCEALREALGSERQDEAAARTFLASVGVRLVG